MADSRNARIWRYWCEDRISTAEIGRRMSLPQELVDKVVSRYLAEKWHLEHPRAQG